MHIVLTHEQADFDAVASLLAAYLLDRNAIPVMPNRMNRNVRAFLTIYGAELPLIEQRDLPVNEPVDSVCLVDTQSMITVRGITSKTQVHVIDHHPQRDDLPSAWTATIDDIGATTTLLVEELQRREIELSIIEASILLLGIYEDTGSLTYSRTTSRDLIAAAYLLDQGASLMIMNDFLNHPLSPAQQSIYDQLRKSAAVNLVHGHTIITACGDATGVQEELSTIAHKLRDLLDPDAIFLLLETRGGVQLIARSSSDQIDVAAVAGHFGGGGHDRAAAALIRDRSCQWVNDELVIQLPHFVRPAITVGEIMSGKPQLLPPETPATEALERMQRFGYEGYPVVRDRQVIGLLTRRAVDRAVAHKLNLTASSLMIAGEVQVYPTDSIEHLQRVMADSGWGQIPVVEPKTGEVIGIVTRTDLLKNLTKQSKRPYPMNLSEQLDKRLPASRLGLLKIIASAAHEQHLPIYVVGGFVRDLLLERPSLDFDIVVEGDAISLAKILANRYGGRVTTHTRFGTAKWYLPENIDLENRAAHQHVSDALDEFGYLPDFIDLISARTEFYTEPTALPTVVNSSIKLDLHRRDFTINTLALRLDGAHYGELFDYWGGLNDLRIGLVRVLHSLSFIDDPTRMLRAVRYEKRYRFEIEPRTLNLLTEALPLLARVTGERLLAEFEHIFDETEAFEMLNRLETLGMLRAIHPDLEFTRDALQRISLLPESLPALEYNFQPPSGKVQRRQMAFMAWFLLLDTKTADSILLRLNYPHREAQSILNAVKLFQMHRDLKSLSLLELIETLDAYDPFVVYMVSLFTSDQVCKELIENYLKSLRKIHPITTGDDLKRKGIPPSPVYKQILGALRKAWLEGHVTNASQETELLEVLLRDIKAG
jgi:tRNA nucleotidyltransferase (CCA-adding enzyme)